jgi:hypothetical protein
MASIDLLDMTKDELNELYQYILTILGGESVEVEITKKEIIVLARRALKQYLYEINTWQVNAQFPNVLGTSSARDFTMRFVMDNALMAQRISDWFASMARIGGKIPWKKDYFGIEDNRQVYNLASESSSPYQPGSRRIHKILWHAPPEVVGATLYSADLVNSNLWSFGQAGMTFNTNRLGYLGQLMDVVLLTQAFKTRNKILFSELTYNISGDIVELLPMPGAHFHVSPGTKVFYYYFDEDDMINVPSQDLANANELIANPTQVNIDYIPYSKINSNAKTWIDEYTLALSKLMYGSKQRQIRKIAAPDADYQIEFDYQSLLQEGEDMKEKLIEELRTTLTKLDPVKMMEDKASLIKNASDINKNSPRTLLIGLVVI